MPRRRPSRTHARSARGRHVFVAEPNPVIGVAPRLVEPFHSRAVIDRNISARDALYLDGYRIVEREVAPQLRNAWVLIERVSDDDDVCFGRAVEQRVDAAGPRGKHVLQVREAPAAFVIAFVKSG